ncbi:MAG: A/G-specific adenine glycosylase [Bryobacterales bacterium]|nr:A/G-specific adenine glycosylase [Bryobacterales bacterium]
MKPDGFAGTLLAWYRQARRKLPWRQTSDPYAILVSEFMLQQTRVSVVEPYFRRFLKRFPDAASLAAATDAELLAHWAGLGYYSRARNLRQAAEAIAASGFPRSSEALRRLPGVGEYTAAAVASIAFGEPVPAVDGNVLRVMARVTNDAGEIAVPATRKRLAAEAAVRLDASHAGDFNQALMELGATICLPRNPQCLLCPVLGHCEARACGTQDSLPVKASRSTAIRQEVSLVVVKRGTDLLLRQRDRDAGRLAGFWELPSPGDLPGNPALRPLGTFRHAITRYQYTVTVSSAVLRTTPAGWAWVSAGALPDLPITTMTRKALALAHSPLC